MILFLDFDGVLQNHHVLRVGGKPKTADLNRSLAANPNVFEQK